MLIIMFQTKILALHSLTFEPHEIQHFVSPLNTLWRGYLIVHTKFVTQYTFPELHNYDVTQNFRIIFKAF